jgi:hypothetical protein
MIIGFHQKRLQKIVNLNCGGTAEIQHRHFLFLAIANLNRQDLIGELLIFRNAN